MKKFITSLMIVFTVCIRLYAIELTSVEAELLVEKDFKDLTFEQWDSKIKYRGVDYKQPEQLVELRKCYERKIPELQEMLLTEKDAEQITFLNTKIARLKDKYTSVLKEIEFREKKLVERELHHTIYYIDYVGGNDTNNGLTTGAAYKTITKYTTTEARSAGDIAYLRANVTWLQGTEATDIVFDENGTIDNYISIIGCDSVTNDPWGDASDVKPIIDFEEASYQFVMFTDDFWRFERIQTARSSDGYAWTIASCEYTYFKDCDWLDMNSSGAGHIYCSAETTVTFDGCTWIDGDDYGVLCYAWRQIFKNCTFTAGAGAGTDYGIRADINAEIFLDSCTFSGTFNVNQILLGDSSVLYGNNVIFTEVEDVAVDEQSRMYIGDYDAFEGHKSWFDEGTIERSTALVRSGGADSSAYFTSNAECGTFSPLILGERLTGFAKVWLTKDVEVNISVYACVASAWDSALGATEAYARFSYLSNAASAARTEVDSTEQISNVAETWTAFTSGAFTPLQTGFVYIWFYLAEYEDASEHIYVDIKPVVN